MRRLIFSRSAKIIETANESYPPIIPALHHYAYFAQFDWPEKNNTSIMSMRSNLGTITLPPAPKMCNNVDKNKILMTKLEL